MAFDRESARQHIRVDRAAGLGASGMRAIFAPLLVGLFLRLWMLKHLFETNGDTLIYGDIAKNILLHARYAISLPGGGTYSTLIRLPGYPLFLAVCFRVFGVENYFAAACIQVALDLAACLLLADFARQIVPAALGIRAALATLWLAVLCPFTASYTAFPLSESPTLFVIALALATMARFCRRPSWATGLGFTFAVTAAAFIRPDGALVAIAFAPAMLLACSPASKNALTRKNHIRMAAVCIVIASSPFALWTLRNWKTFHVFEPLAPRLANDPGEDPDLGWEHWVKTWCLDFTSTYEVYWNVPWDRLDLNKLPQRAFDSPAQYAETAALVGDYNSHGMEITPEIDSRFERLAQERIAAQPLRYYVIMPMGRLLDMWLRPRTENLPIDLDWWNYRRHHRETEFSWVWAALNLAYLILGCAGLMRRPSFWQYMLAYIVFRSALLLTIEAPETRYTLECFPLLFVGGGVAIATSRLGGYFAKLKALPGTD